MRTRVAERSLWCALILILTALPLTADRKAELDWRSDLIMQASVSFSEKAVAMKDLCRLLERQTSVEFYVDRRFADTTAAVHISSARLETAMTCIEEITGLQWRLVDDMFFLTEDARGTAVVQWKKRYEEAKKSEIAKTTKNLVDTWLYDAMPFPASFDLEWDLTPLQAEQMAYGSALSVFTMTPPQLMWLDDALLANGYKPGPMLPTELLIRQSPDLTVKLNAAMLIDSPQGMLIVEKPLTAPTPKPAVEPAPRTTNVGETVDAPEKETALKGKLKGVWITDDEPGDLSRLLKAAKARGFDNIFLPVLSRGQTPYWSAALHPDVEIIRVDDGPNRMQAAITQAKALDMKVHAVLDATLWGDATHPAPKPASLSAVQDRNLLDRSYSEQAQWQQAESAAMDPTQTVSLAPPSDKSVYLCPASSQTARLLKSLVKEIAGFDIAGVCLDRLQYPRNEPFVVNGLDMAVPFGYTIEVRKQMIRAHQVDPIDIDLQGARSPAEAEVYAVWDRFRRGKLTGLITEVSEEFRAVKPDGIFSITLDPESDAQSPSHWALVEDVDALLPSVQIGAAEEGDLEEQADVQTVNALYDAVSEHAAVVPAVRGGERDSTRLSSLASTLDPGKADRGLVLVGESSALIKALEGMEAASGQ